MQTRRALTLRVPPVLLEEARVVKAPGESLNDLVLQALEREVRRRRALEAYAQIVRIRSRVRKRTGPRDDAVALVRALRSGEGRRG